HQERNQETDDPGNNGLCHLHSPKLAAEPVELQPQRLRNGDLGLRRWGGLGHGVSNAQILPDSGRFVKALKDRVEFPAVFSGIKRSLARVLPRFQSESEGRKSRQIGLGQETMDTGAPSLPVSGSSGSTAMLSESWC